MNQKFFPRLRLWSAVGLTVVLAGCSNMASHDKLASEVHATGQSQGVPAALARLEASATTESEKTALLYNM